ncbi:MAG TPA: CPBP family intramembrane glutamic endopeptidase, partial [Polyangiales bacterium]|nr:CPBP family intramembrane glutamic endopeptidase [Polyangiales bacterium]
ELCARDGLPERLWRDQLDFAVLDLDAKQLMLRVPLDAAHLARAQRGSAGACLLLAQGPLPRDATYSIEAVWSQKAPSDAVMNVPVHAHVLAKPPLSALDRATFALFGVALLGLLLSAFFARRDPMSPIPPTPENASPAASPRFALWGVPVAFAILVACIELRFAGSTLTLLKGVLLLAVQAVLAFALSRRRGDGVQGTLAAVAWTAPEHRSRALFAAVLAWPLLVLTAKLSLLLVPATGEAPIETFVSWPSGMLSAALLGGFLPMGEELFFRGYLYGALLRFGRATAAAVSLAAFVALHAPQSWGEWGALVAVACAGATFTALRIATGSALVPALTHVAYNLALSASSIFRG